MTMEDVMRRAQVAKAYQCEVERNLDPGDHTKKFRVSQKKLDPWLKCLGITEEFAIGAIPEYHRQPEQSRGLALDVGMAIRAAPDLGAWRDLTGPERARQLLQLIARESARLPRVVLAYLLGLELLTLDAMLTGDVLVPKAVADALPDLTLLPRAFLDTGGLEPDLARYQPYLPLMEFAIEHQIPPDRLREAMRGLTASQPPASRPRKGS
jgi:hypothetical protein